MGMDIRPDQSFHRTQMKRPNRPLQFWTITVLSGAALLTYLFATAPVPLDTGKKERMTMSTEEALTLLAHENDVTRTLFTKAIVGKGKAQGLTFSEDWAEQHVIAGPLPALFLRGVARHLADTEVPLSLFLGSDFPIEGANLFEGRQAEEFAAMRMDSLPKHFLDGDSNSHVSMFPDFAGAAPCVNCHNAHERSPKSDWAMGDIMGATTWAYPSDSVTTDEFMAMLNAYRAGVSVVWSDYLAELDQMQPNAKPAVGNEWPSAGLFIPDHATLRDSIDDLAGPHILSQLARHTTRR